MSHNHREIFLPEPEQPTRELAQQSAGDALQALNLLDRARGDSPFAFLGGPLTRQRNRILSAHAEAVIDRLRLDFEAHERVHREWHERQLVHMKSNLRAEEVEHHINLLARVYTVIRRLGHEVALDIEQGLKDATTLESELARKLRTEDLNQMQREYVQQCQLLRDNFAASLKTRGDS